MGVNTCIASCACEVLIFPAAKTQLVFLIVMFPEWSYVVIKNHKNYIDYEPPETLVQLYQAK